jgi:hypothetical protein
VLATGRGESPTDDLGKLPVSRLSPLSPVNELNFTEFHFIFLFCFFKLFCARRSCNPDPLLSNLDGGSCFILFSSFVFFSETLLHTMIMQASSLGFGLGWRIVQSRPLLSNLDGGSQIEGEESSNREGGGGRSEAVARW